MSHRTDDDLPALSVLLELDVANGQTEPELKMHLGASQQSSLEGVLERLRAKGRVRCDGAGRWWIV